MMLEGLSWTSVTGWLLLGTFTLIAVWIWRASQVYKTFKILGIPGPSPTLVIGNVGYMAKKGMGAFTEWKNKYGNVYGVFMASKPTLVVHDLDLLKDVLVKKFPSFANRQPQPAFDFEPWKYNLVALRDDHWKHVRNILSPTFSSGKLRKLMPALERVIQNFTANVRAHALSGEPVELKEYSGCFAMDAIAGAAFGIQVDSIQNPNDPFVQNSLTLLNQRQWIFPFFLMFPWLAVFLIKCGYYIFPRSATDFFVKIIDAALKERRQENKKYPDFLQLLVDAERENETESAVQTQVDAEIDHGKYLQTSAQWTRKTKGLTQQEIHGNGVTFFGAGYDTVSTVMSFTLFCLAANPECLRKAQAEIDEKLGKKSANYETVHELTYIDMCMNEAMRLYPPGFLTEREAADDLDLGGYSVKKGIHIIIPTCAIHTDPELWPDPMKFDPERHTPEARASRHPFSFMPFGLGPRNCIGMRLAQLEIRMALASLLQNFSLSLCEKSVNPPRLQKLRMGAEDGLWVKFQLRT